MLIKVREHAGASAGSKVRSADQCRQSHRLGNSGSWPVAAIGNRATMWALSGVRRTFSELYLQNQICEHAPLALCNL